MFYKDKKVLVTGGSGLAGSHLIEALLNKGAIVTTVLHKKPITLTTSKKIDHSNIYVVEGDLCNSDFCWKALEGQEYVFHCAAVTSGAYDIVNNPAKHITSNLIMCSRLLEVANLAKVERFLFMSSTTVYPDGDDPMAEGDVWKGDVHPSYQAVGWMKRYVEKLCEFYHDRTDLNTCIIRPANFYGPRDDFNLETAHALPALIRRLVDGEDPLSVWGDGSAIRDFAYVQDIVDGMLLIMEKFCCGAALNIGSGLSTSIKDAIEIVIDILGTNPKIEYDPSKPSTIPIRRMDVSLAKEIIGFTSSYELEEGLRLTIDWFKQNREKYND